MTTAAAPLPHDLDRLAALTARYARYSRSAGGLSSVIGGVACLAVYLAAIALPLSSSGRIALATAPLLWLLSKELLRALYYQRVGAVAERTPARELRLHRLLTALIALVSLLVIAGVLSQRAPATIAAPGWAYLAIVALMPVACWRWFWSIGDFLVGVLLFCQSAVLIAGDHYPLHWLFVMVAFSTIAIVGGLREHREYLQLRRELLAGGAA